MSEKGKKKVILGMFSVLVAMIVALAAIVGVKLSRVECSWDDQTKIISGSVQEESDGKIVGETAVHTGNEETENVSADTGNRNYRGEDMFTSFDYPDNEEIREALMAYQEYIDGNEKMYFDGYLLAYIDEDDIPELIAIGNCEATGQVIITYRDGELLENYIGRLGGLRYVKKQNFYYNSNGNMGCYYDEFYRLVNGEQTVIMSGCWGDKRDEEGKVILNEELNYPEQEYVWNGRVCGEEEYYDAIDKFVEETVGDAELIKVDSYGDDLYDNIPDAYEGLKYRKYAEYWPQIKEFTLENGVLTYSAGGGGYYGWGNNDDIRYTISYPVAKDCIWEERDRGRREHYQLEVADTDYIRDTTYEKIRKLLDTEKELFDETVHNSGRDKVWVQSPVSVVVVVKEDVVVRVYTVTY